MIPPTLRDRSRQALARSIRRSSSQPNDSHAAGATCSAPNPVEVAQINDAMRRLLPIERDVLMAVRLEDCSYAEIAKRLGLSIWEVERLFVRAFTNYLRNLK